MSREVGVEGHRRIRAPVHRVWQLLARPEALPRYSSLWMAADVLERSGNTALVEFRGFVGGLPVTSVQRVTLRPPTRLEFRQVRGELLRLSGSLTLEEVDGETEVTYQIAIEPGIPLFTESAVLQILAAHVEVLLGRLKATAERDLVRVVVRRRAAAQGTGTATGLAVGADADDGEADGAQAPAALGDTAGADRGERHEGEGPPPAAAAVAERPEAAVPTVGVPDAADVEEAPGAPGTAGSVPAAPADTRTPPGPQHRRGRRRRRRRRPPAPPRSPAGP